MYELVMGWMNGWLDGSHLSILFVSLFFHSLRIPCTDLDKRPCNILLVGVCAYCISSCSRWPLSSPHQGSGKASQLMTLPDGHVFRMVTRISRPLAETISHDYPPKFPSVPKSLESDLELRLILSLGQGDSDVQHQC